MRRTYDAGDAAAIATKLGIDFEKSGFDLEQFRAGLDVEGEHGAADPTTNVTDDDPLATGKITLAHLNEIPDYYTRLKLLEDGAISAQEGGADHSGNALRDWSHRCNMLSSISGQEPLS